MNVEEVDRILAWIKANPDLHNQRHWIRTRTNMKTGECGTTMCMAGTTVALNGYLPGPSLAVQTDQFITSETVKCHPADQPDKTEPIDRVAARILDFTPEERDWFFLNCHTLGDLLEARDAIVNKGMTPVYNTDDPLADNMELIPVADLDREEAK